MRPCLLFYKRELEEYLRCFFSLFSKMKTRLFNAFSPNYVNAPGTGQDKHVDKQHLLHVCIPSGRWYVEGDGPAWAVGHPVRTHLTDARRSWRDQRRDVDQEPAAEHHVRLLLVRGSQTSKDVDDSGVDPLPMDN